LFLLFLCAAGFSPELLAAAGANSWFKIVVVDQQTGRGVPLVELRTVNEISLWTDSNGISAFDEPGLMDQEVYFHVRSHGYEFPKDGFGNRGVKLKPVKGGSTTIQIQRRNIAERLYRITGAGIYRDSLLTGHPVPLRQPVLDGEVMGQDTVIATPYRGKIYWFWGDTERVSYPLGNFAASGATSDWPGHGGLDPGTGVDLTYFVDASGFSKGMCPNFGPGLQWIEGVMTLPDESGRERLVARVSSQKGLVPAYAWHLAVFNDEKEVFESKVRWEITEGHDSSHPFRARSGGIEYLYLYPNLRVKADFQSLSDLKRYEAFTCVAGDGRTGARQTAIDRRADGAPLYAWKAGADRLHPGRFRQLIASRDLKASEAWMQLHDFETGTPIEPGRGSVYWNAFRQRWVMLISAKPGEVWFGEGDTPVGPWVYARRVVAHDNYNFYNPTQHPIFDQDGGRLIYFEGTYTASFSAAKEKTPRYDYNQIMYRLALDDPRLNLPVPVYRVKSAGGESGHLTREGVEREQAWDRIEAIAFFAFPPNRGRGGMMPLFAATQNGHAALRDQPGSDTQPVFFALPLRRPPADDKLDGAWECKLKSADGEEYQIKLDLRVEGERVGGTASDGVVVGEGSFKDRMLKIEMRDEGKTYDFTAELKLGKLAGQWKERNDNPTGTWSANRRDTTPPEEKSPAVVPLYEYVAADGRREYATNPELPDKELERRSEALCLVWANPMSVLALDRGVKPVPVEAP
jgi:hypothetical protein